MLDYAQAAHADVSATLPLQMLRKFLAEQPDALAGQRTGVAADGGQTAAAAAAAAPAEAAGSSTAGAACTPALTVAVETAAAAPAVAPGSPGMAAAAAAAVPAATLLPAAVLLPALAISASGAGAAVSVGAALTVAAAALWARWPGKGLPSAVSAAALAQQLRQLWRRLQGAQLQAAAEEEAAAAAAGAAGEAERLPDNFYEQQNWPRWVVVALQASAAWYLIDAALK